MILYAVGGRKTIYLLYNGLTS